MSISTMETESTVAPQTLPSESEPVTDRETAVTVAEAPPEPYCSRRGSRLLHRHDCAWVARIAHGDRVYWKRMADASSEGLMTCPVCEPWEPA
jgi:hypothetical protein